MKRLFILAMLSTSVICNAKTNIAKRQPSSAVKCTETAQQAAAFVDKLG